jgi:hypothetical protein
MRKHFIDPKSSEILSIFQVFPCMTQIALFGPKLLPALFLKKPWYPCPFEILAETLLQGIIFTDTGFDVRGFFLDVDKSSLHDPLYLKGFEVVSMIIKHAQNVTKNGTQENSRSRIYFRL